MIQNMLLSMLQKRNPQAYNQVQQMMQSGQNPDQILQQMMASGQVNQQQLQQVQNMAKQYGYNLQIPNVSAPQNNGFNSGPKTF